jgi:hypothetical protein
MKAKAAVKSLSGRARRRMAAEAYPEAIWSGGEFFCFLKIIRAPQQFLNLNLPCSISPLDLIQDGYDGAGLVFLDTAALRDIQPQVAGIL